MDRPTAPWGSARLAQGVIAAVAVAEVVRAVTVRAYDVRPDAATLRGSGIAAMVYLSLTAVAMVVFLVWLGRCRRNAELLSPGVAAVPGAWGVLAWLIPVVNWWFPRRFLLDVQRASGGASAGLVNAWAVFWVLHFVTVTAGAAMGAAANVSYIVVQEGCCLAAAVLAIRVIQHITTLQGATPLAPLAPTPA
jgi:hypothetical protein